MNLRCTDTELFAKIWQPMYTAFGKVNICDRKMMVERNKYDVVIIQEKRYGYPNDFVMGEAVYVSDYSDDKKNNCRRGVVVEGILPEYVDVMIPRDNDRAAVVHMRRGDNMLRLVRQPEEFEGTWVVKLTHSTELAAEVRENERWRKMIPDAGPNIQNPDAGNIKSKRKVTFYPRDIAEMEEIIDYIAGVIAN